MSATKKQNKRISKVSFFLPKDRTTLTYEVVRILISLFFGVLGYLSAHILLFTSNPLLGVTYVGEIVVAVACFATVYYLIPFVIRAVNDALKMLVKQSLYDNMSLITSSRKKRTPKITKQYDKPILLDTSAIIDGRFCSVLENGFITSQILVPQFVLDELQTLSDSKTKITRDKGRRGLQILEKIKTIHKSGFQIYPTKKSKSVDKALVLLAKKVKGRVATVDYNLNKVAKVSGVKVLNVNALANSIKISVIPGDTITLEVRKQGSNKDQGVGYLEDGTMVVVNGAGKYLNKYINVQIDKILQKESGQMVFAKRIT
jgi:uncharacterized protein YacL